MPAPETLPGPASRREVLSWCLYDFANSPFTTLIVTFIFSRYFTQALAPDSTSGTVLWSRAVNVSALLVALTTPLLGAIADLSGRKKHFLAVATAQCIVFTSLLFFMQPGMAPAAAVLFVLANLGFEGANVFYNAFLPEISTRRNIGRISGYGWALGYLGGLAALGIALYLVRGGLPSEGHFAVRATTLLVAVWFLVFSLPLFLILRERAPRGNLPPTAYARAGGRRLIDTFRHLRRYRQAMRMLVARLVYNDGLVTIFSFGAIFAAAVYGMDTSAVILLGIVLNIAAALGSWVFGFVNDRIGGKRTILITLVVLTLAAVLGAISPGPAGFWAAAIAIGLMVGPNQSASRSLLGVLVPYARRGEFFGFFAFSGKLASVAGPLLYGTVVGATQSHRLAMGSCAAFFVLGGLLLLTVDEPAGIDEAARATREDGEPAP